MGVRREGEALFLLPEDLCPRVYDQGELVDGGRTNVKADMGAGEVQGGGGRGSAGMRGYGGRSRTGSRENSGMGVDILRGDGSCGSAGALRRCDRAGKGWGTHQRGDKLR